MYTNIFIFILHHIIYLYSLHMHQLCTILTCFAIILIVFISSIIKYLFLVSFGWCFLTKKFSRLSNETFLFSQAGPLDPTTEKRELQERTGIEQMFSP